MNTHSRLGTQPDELTARIVLGKMAIVVMACMSCLSCATPRPDLPPILRPPSAEHHVGKVVWVDLVTPDLDVAERFYGKLFNWSFCPGTSTYRGYVVAYAGDRPVGGLVTPAVSNTERRQSAWLTYIAVEDAVAASRLAITHGAKALSEIHTYPTRGRQAILADPQGAVFAIVASSAGDPPDYLAEPDQWIWSSLITTDPDADAAFYEATFGYEEYVLPTDHGVQQVILESGGYARASVNGIPYGAPPIHPRWINFVRVEDVVDKAATAQSLGGRVVVEPHVDRHGGRLAILADPAGAFFGVMEWPDGDKPKGAK